MTGYYDHHALIQLRRHVAVYGLLTAETRSTGQRAAAFCGLTWRDVQQTVEHTHGRSFDELRGANGPEWSDAEQTRALQRLLAEEPAGLLTLSDSALLPAGNLELARARTDLVALDLDLSGLFWRLRGRLIKRPGDATGYPIERIEQLRAYYEQREPALAAARLRIPMAGRSVEELARALTDWLLQPDA